jgi:CNT family concentrative nucleoside transporter
MIVQSIAGLFIVAGLTWLMSENRKEAKLKIAGIGIVIQLLVGLLLLKLPVFREFFLLFGLICKT